MGSSLILDLGLWHDSYSYLNLSCCASTQSNSCHFEEFLDRRPKTTCLRWWQRVPGEKGHLLPGSVSLAQSFPQLAVLTCARLVSCDTCFSPTREGCLQAVDFWGLQISQRGTTVLSVGYFSRGKGNNFLKSIRM